SSISRCEFSLVGRVAGILNVGARLGGEPELAQATAYPIWQDHGRVVANGDVDAVGVYVCHAVEALQARDDLPQVLDAAQWLRKLEIQLNGGQEAGAAGDGRALESWQGDRRL